MYIAGTRPSIFDVADDLLIPFDLTSHGHRFADADKAMQHTVKRFVGHSLGGATALSMGDKYGLPTEVYGTPVFSGAKSAHRHRFDWDPISMFDTGAQSGPSPSWNPHSY